MVTGKWEEHDGLLSGTYFWRDDFGGIHCDTALRGDRVILE